MKCIYCNTTFTPRPSLGGVDGDAVEVKITCPKPGCEAEYYDFTSGRWTSDRQATSLIKSLKGGAR